MDIIKNLLKLILVAVISTGIFCVSGDRNNPFDENGSNFSYIVDADGNVYQTVKIGNQIWTKENLKTTTYNDGTPIPKIVDSAGWNNRKKPGYCWYEYNEIYKKKYGALYNWYVVDPANPKKIAPPGWHVPTDEEWRELEVYLIGAGYNWDGTIENNKIGKALASNTGGWRISETIGHVGNDQHTNDSSGFSALPSGTGKYDGTFNSIGNSCSWWSATGDTINAIRRALQHDNDYLEKVLGPNGYGLSIRLVKD